MVNFCTSGSVKEKKFSFPSSLLLDIYPTPVSKSVKKCLDAGVKPDS